MKYISIKGKSVPFQLYVSRKAPRRKPLPMVEQGMLLSLARRTTESRPGTAVGWAATGC